MKAFERTKEVKYFMTKAIVSTGPETPVYKLACTMARKRISCILIVNKTGKPAGIVTERDINKRIVAANVNAKKTKAKEAMSRPVIFISGNKDLTEAMEIMRKKHVRRLVVIDDNKKVMGLITLTDVSNALYDILVEKLHEINAVYHRTQQLFKDSVKALFQALDAKDHYTGAHSREVAKLAYAISNELNLDEQSKRNIYLAGLFHDIGKIHISDKVLNKKGPLLQEEYEELKKHPIISEMILRPITEFKDVLDIIRHHHEWYDGKGYPDNIKGEAIPLGARIICLADSYNAMRTNRPYREAMKRETAIKNIKEMTGRQFDPGLVKYFMKVLEKNPAF